MFRSYKPRPNPPLGLGPAGGLGRCLVPIQNRHLVISIGQSVEPGLARQPVATRFTRGFSKPVGSDDTRGVNARSHRRWICHAACLTLAGLSSACNSGAGPKSIDNPDATMKIQAIVTGDSADIPKLIRELDNDDAAVRFYAFDKLKQLTGETFGYQYFVDEDKRAAAIEQWRAWLKGWEAGRHSSDVK